ncbi:hypothetical protein [Fictibacillus nanhaiensis]|uniref:hypothetical protein n=1 Tax=Fictibacillus nanhaiensis TaxID=742169 RepID=UPI003C1E2E4D
MKQFVHQNKIMILSSFLIPLVFFVLFSLIKGLPFMIITSDGELYKNLAGNFLNGKGLINTVREENIIVPPLYPLIIAFIIYFFKDITFVFLVQFLVLGSTGIVIFLLAYRLFINKVIAILSVVLFSIHPILLNNGPSKLLTETIFTFFIVAIALLGTVILHMVKNTEKKNLSILIVLFVITFYLSIMMRPHLLFLIPIVIGYFIFLNFNKIIPIWVILFSILVPILLFGANYTYNKTTHGEGILFENYSGMNLYIANNPHTTVGFYSSSIIEKFVSDEYNQYKNTPLSEKSKILKAKAVEYILAEPGEFIKRLVQKIQLFFEGVNRFDTLLTLFSIGGYITAFIILKNLRIHLLIIGLYILYFAVLSSVGLLVSSQRYRLPIIPLYTIFGSYLIYTVTSSYGKWLKTKTR